MDTDKELWQEATEIINQKISILNRSDTNAKIFQIFHEIESTLKLKNIDFKLVNDEDILLIIDESFKEEGFDSSKFSADVLQLLLVGLSKEQRIAKFIAKLEGYRYQCVCGTVDWDDIKDSFLVLAEEISK